MAKDRECVTSNGKASFYASIYDDLRNAAMGCGWALGLHGSLVSDMDIMAMPWTADAKPVEVMIQALSDCFTGCPFKEQHTIPHYDKPNNRVVYTMNIFSDWYLDINIINTELQAQVEHLQAHSAELQARARELEDMLKELEWSYEDDPNSGNPVYGSNIVAYCPVCGERNEHDLDCKLAQLLQGRAEHEG